MKSNKFSTQAQAGKMIELQDCHETYQVLLKIVKAHGNKKKEESEDSEEVREAQGGLEYMYELRNL